MGDKYTTDNGEGPPESAAMEEEQGDFAGVEVETARAEWENGRRSACTGKVLYLLKVMGVLKFPVSPADHLSRFARNIVGEGRVRGDAGESWAPKVRSLEWPNDEATCCHAVAFALVCSPEVQVGVRCLPIGLERLDFLQQATRQTMVFI